MPQDERKVRPNEDRRREERVPKRRAPSERGDGRDEPERREKPGDLLDRAGSAEEDRTDETIAPDPRSDERQRIEQIGAPAHGERRET